LGPEKKNNGAEKKTKERERGNDEVKQDHSWTDEERKGKFRDIINMKMSLKRTFRTSMVVTELHFWVNWPFKTGFSKRGLMKANIELH